MNRFGMAVLISLMIVGASGAETFRTIIAGKIDISPDNPEGSSLTLSFVDSALIRLEGDRRFLRGVELDLRVPQQYFKYRGSVAAAFYAPIRQEPAAGVADLNAERVGFELVPNKLQTVFHLPTRQNHGLKASPYASIPSGVLLPGSFPVLFRLLPVIKGLPEELESLRFQLHARPILSDEGALKLSLRFPEKLKDKPFTVLVDDAVVDPARELLLIHGEHSLAVLSDDYRNESRRFVVERAKTLELTIELQDPTPLVRIEAPENARVFFDDQPVADPRNPFPAEPGEHTVRFVVGDYSVVKPITVRKGRTYRVALSVDVSVDESE